MVAFFRVYCVDVIWAHLSSRSPGSVNRHLNVRPSLNLATQMYCVGFGKPDNIFNTWPQLIPFLLMVSQSVTPLVKIINRAVGQRSTLVLTHWVNDLVVDRKAYKSLAMRTSSYRRDLSVRVVSKSPRHVDLAMTGKSSGGVRWTCDCIMTYMCKLIGSAQLDCGTVPSTSQIGLSWHKFRMRSHTTCFISEFI